MESSNQNKQANELVVQNPQIILISIATLINLLYLIMWNYLKMQFTKIRIAFSISAVVILEAFLVDQSQNKPFELIIIQYMQVQMADLVQSSFNLYYFYFYSMVIPYSIVRISLDSNQSYNLAQVCFIQISLFFIPFIVELQRIKNQDNQKSRNSKQEAGNQNNKISVHGYIQQDTLFPKQISKDNSLCNQLDRKESNFKRNGFQFQKQLKQNQTEYFLREMLENLSSGVALVQNDLKLIKSNKTFRSFFSKSFEKFNLEENLMNYQFNCNSNLDKQNKTIDEQNVTSNYQLQKQYKSYDDLPMVSQDTKNHFQSCQQSNNLSNQKQNQIMSHKTNFSIKEFKQLKTKNLQEQDSQQEALNKILNYSNFFYTPKTNANFEVSQHLEDFSKQELLQINQKIGVPNPDQREKIMKWKKQQIQLDEELSNLLNSDNFSINQVIKKLFQNSINSFRMLKSEFTIDNNSKVGKKFQKNLNSKSKFCFQENNQNEKKKNLFQIVNNNTLILRGKTQSGETLFKFTIFSLQEENSKQQKPYLRFIQDIFEKNENFQIDLKEQIIMIELIDIDNFVKQRDISHIKSFKKKMLASLSHELRTPLNCSMQLIETLYHSGLLENEDRDLFLAPAIQSNQLLLHIINDILDYCQINNGDLKLTFEEFEFRKAVYECIQLFALQSSQKNIPIELNIDSQLPLYIRSDMNRFKQVFLNLLSNAVKFTFQGKITVKIEYCQLQEQSIENVVKISIQDTGCGMTPEKAKHIFEGFNCNNLLQNNSFYANSKNNSQIIQEQNYEDTNIYNENTNQIGVGLGLSISQNLAKGLGSNRGIEFQSQINVGSTFTFYVTDRKKQVPGAKLNIRSFHNVQFVKWQSLESSSNRQIGTSMILADKSKHAQMCHKSNRYSQFQLDNSSQRKVSIQISHFSQSNQSDKAKTSNQLSKSSLVCSEGNIDINQDSNQRKKSKLQDVRNEKVQLQSLRKWQQDLDMQMYISYSDLPRNFQDFVGIQNSCVVEETNSSVGSQSEVIQGRKFVKNFEIQASGIYLGQGNQIFQKPIKQLNNLSILEQDSKKQWKIDSKSANQMLQIFNFNDQIKLSTIKYNQSSKSIPCQSCSDLEFQQSPLKYNQAAYIYSQNQINQENKKTSQVEISKKNVNCLDKFTYNQNINFGSTDSIKQSVFIYEDHFDKKSNSLISISLNSQDLNSPQKIQNKNECDNKKLNQNKKTFIFQNIISQNLNQETQIYQNNIDIIKQKVNETYKCDFSNVLLVDDNDFNLYALEIRLKPYDIKVDKVNNGFLALNKVQTRFYSNSCCQKYQLIFMDIDMPIKNGYETAQDINSFFNSINMKNLSPISACTAFIQEEEQKQAYLSGMQFYITKPVNTQKLEEVLLKVYQI